MAAKQKQQQDVVAQCRAWLASVGLTTKKRDWYVYISLDEFDGPPRTNWHQGFDVEHKALLHVHCDGWGIMWHNGRTRRDSDTAFHTTYTKNPRKLRDPTPERLLEYLAALEKEHKCKLRREHAEIESNIKGAEGPLRAWLAR